MANFVLRTFYHNKNNQPDMKTKRNKWEKTMQNLKITTEILVEKSKEETVITARPAAIKISGGRETQGDGRVRDGAVLTA